MIRNPVNLWYYHPNFICKESEVAEGPPKITQYLKPTVTGQRGRWCEGGERTPRCDGDLGTGTGGQKWASQCVMGKETRADLGHKRSFMLWCHVQAHAFSSPQVSLVAGWLRYLWLYWERQREPVFPLPLGVRGRHQTVIIQSPRAHFFSQKGNRDAGRKKA